MKELPNNLNVQTELTEESKVVIHADKTMNILITLRIQIRI